MLRAIEAPILVVLRLASLGAICASQRSDLSVHARHRTERRFQYKADQQRPIRSQCRRKNVGLSGFTSDLVCLRPY